MDKFPESHIAFQGTHNFFYDHLAFNITHVHTVTHDNTVTHVHTVTHKLPHTTTPVYNYAAWLKLQWHKTKASLYLCD